MNGPFKTAFSDLGLFLAVAQTFEDTGVRAYKGRAAELKGPAMYLPLHCRYILVEARHASYIRKVRKDLGSGVGDLKPWITGNQSGINSDLVQASYNGEETTVQATINIVNINGFDIDADAATESFDEALSPEQVLAIIDGFLVNPLILIYIKKGVYHNNRYAPFLSDKLFHYPLNAFLNIDFSLYSL